MSGRGRGRGRGRPPTNDSGTGVTTRSSKRGRDPNSNGEETVAKVPREDDPNDLVSDGEDDEVTFKLDDNIQKVVSDTVNKIMPDAIAQVLPETINAILPDLVSKVTEATVTALKTHTMAAPPAVPGPSTTNTPIQKAVDRQSGTILGGNDDNCSSPNLDTIKNDDDHVPLDLHLKPDQLAKIAGNKYVKFGELLVKEQRDNEKMTLQIGDENNLNGKQIMVNPYHNQVKIIHIGQWDRAYTIYKYVFLKSHPEDAQGMIVYEQLIKDMAFKGLKWAEYDRQFRRLREREPTKHPWGHTNITLYAQSMVGSQGPSSQTLGNYKNQGQMNKSTNFGQSQNNFRGGQNYFRGQRSNGQNSNGQNPNSQNSGKKKCFAFNKGFCRYGSGCIFRHVCDICEQNHPSVRCQNR